MSIDFDTVELARRLVEEVDVSQSFASQLATGTRRPSLVLAVKIEDAMRIPPRFWIKRNEVSQDQDGEATLNDSEFSGAGHE